jgi:tight adherence protein C
VQAGFAAPSALRMFHFARMVSIVAFAAIGLIVPLFFGMRGFRPLLLMFIGAGLGAYIPTFYLKRRTKKRKRKLTEQLSDVLDLLVVCVEAGLGLGESIKIVGNETERQLFPVSTSWTVSSD